VLANILYHTCFHQNYHCNVLDDIIFWMMNDGILKTFLFTFEKISTAFCDYV